MGAEPLQSGNDTHPHAIDTLRSNRTSQTSETLTKPEDSVKQVPAQPPADAGGPPAGGPPGGPGGPAGPPDHVYPPTRTVILLMACLFSAGFLVALDRTIIGTAIPVITDDFHSLNDVGWYASAYMLTACSFQLFMGRVYTFYNPKHVWLSSVLIFEVGSAICGAAPNSSVFILGRAVAGLGSCGVFSGAIVIMMYAIPLYKRPQYTGIMGAVFGVASVVGPLLGGVFTDNVSWRWCFYINLPIGAVAAVIIMFFVKLNIPRRKSQTFRKQLHQLDPLGNACFLPGVSCLLLALQWGGTTYAWSNWRVILCIVLFVILMVAFIAIQIWKKETATVPPRIFIQRSVTAGMWWTVMNGASMMTLVYFLPIWFQAIKGVSAEKSGIMSIPMVLSLVIGSMGAGFLTRKIGYYTPWMFGSAVIMPIGAGLITTFTPSTNHPAWIGYQVTYGFGLGLGMQQANVGVQAALARKDVPTGASLMFFAQSFGGAVFVSVANNIFDNKLAKGLAGIAGLDPQQVVKIGATDLRKYVSEGLLPKVLQVYNDALVDAFYVCLALSCCTIFGAIFMPMLSIKGKESGGPQGGKGSPPQGEKGAPPATGAGEKPAMQ